MKIDGNCKKGFERVAEAFTKNFGEHGEVGASVCLYQGSERVVDLWGGIADPKTKTPWTKDTVSIVFSCTKGATALCAHILASRGKLDLDAPVAELWPEFAQKGKDRVTTRMMLDHSAGVPALRAPVKDSGPYEWDYMTERLAEEEPFWVPGTRNGYHGFTFGWTVGEMVRRAAGKSLGTFFRDEVAKPLGLDFWIGLPEAIEPRVAPIMAYTYRPEQARTPFMRDLADKQSIPALFFFNCGAWRTGGANTRAGRAAEVPAANGITNARGLAGMYAPLAQGGGKLVDGKTLARMGEVSMATHDDATLRVPTRFALGFMKSMDNRKRSPGAVIFGPDCDSVIMSSAAFGHVGAGGSLGFADPAAGFSFGYTMNQMGPGLLMNDRGQALVDAAYLSLGYKNKDGGVWVR
ncbi:MAG TPA: serine hydrolase domain-containing protein [Reyranella sp.]|jgi:CubicO group peptidase (beta-lactamase class C family)|nr:serine hydrolase domain-containing protein [Reyranella sp.]